MKDMRIYKLWMIWEYIYIYILWMIWEYINYERYDNIELWKIWECKIMNDMRM